RHDQQLIGDTLFEDRTMYNCFINSAVSPAGGVNERVYTTMDIFPTVLAAMGFTVEGDRLGLGVNLFSEQKTLSEQIGYQLFNEELGKYSEYYVRNFS
ncbi:MAG: hypothetical protein IKB34_09130, partial [Clostridia bacterium]|nr:hypothetical protein [Clostridia bacterium]